MHKATLTSTFLLHIPSAIIFRTLRCCPTRRRLGGICESIPNYRNHPHDRCDTATSHRSVSFGCEPSRKRWRCARLTSEVHKSTIGFGMVSRIADNWNVLSLTHLCHHVWKFNGLLHLKRCFDEGCDKTTDDMPF
jgi:hypothetical protein